METKLCIKCGEVRALDEYYDSSKPGGGKHSRCKACAREYQRLYSQRNREMIRGYGRQYYQDNREERIESMAFAKSNDPLKCKAQNQINAAIRSGRVTRPEVCEACKNAGYIDSHHDDYALPFLVVWLCRSCHLEFHRGKDKNSDRIRAKVKAIFKEKLKTL